MIALPKIRLCVALYGNTPATFGYYISVYDAQRARAMPVILQARVQRVE